MKLKTIGARRCRRLAVACCGGLVALASTAAQAAGEAQAAVKSTALTLEAIPGAGVSRVILSPKAMERLGIQTGQVSEEAVARRQMVSGLVVPVGDKAPDARPGGSFAGAGGFGGYGRPAPAAGAAAAAVAPPAAQPRKPVAGEVWVLVALSPGEYERLARDKPARLLPLATRESPWRELPAQPNGMEPVEDVKRTMLAVYYKVSGKDHGLAINDRLRVELPMSGSEDKQKAVPYGAVYYDAKGGAWVYVNTAPLAYERRKVAVERVIGDRALLSDGPGIGTPVVTVGAALLYGAEIFKK